MNIEDNNKKTQELALKIANGRKPKFDIGQKVIYLNYKTTPYYDHLDQTDIPIRFDIGVYIIFNIYIYGDGKFYYDLGTTSKDRVDEKNLFVFDYFYKELEKELEKIEKYSKKSYEKKIREFYKNFDDDIEKRIDNVLKRYNFNIKYKDLIK